MNIYLLIALRLIHVVAGTLWFGTAVFYLFFLKPSVKAIGPAAPQFMQSLTQRRKYPLFMMSTSLLTVTAGIWLYVNNSGTFQMPWITSGVGLGYTIGAVAALVAFVVGSTIIGPTSGRMGALGQQMAAAGGPPDPEKLSLMQALEKRLARAEQLDFWMLTIAMLTMATARYWKF